MFCTNCGQGSSVQNQRFCDSCGTSLISSSTPATPQIGLPPQAPIANPATSIPQSQPTQSTFQQFPPAPSPTWNPPMGVGFPLMAPIDPNRIPSLTFGQSIRYCLSNFFSVQGRGVRTEYWYFQLAGFLLNILAALILPSVLGDLLSLVIVIPVITAGVRRMHDVGNSGWFLLVPFYNLVLLCTEGDAFANRYGNPVDYTDALASTYVSGR